MFRNNELLAGQEKIMHQKDIERFAFLYLCGQRDRVILAGTERMTFEDFDRLAYITDFLGMDQMNLEIWNLFSWQFCEQFQAIERLRKENCRNMEFRIYEDDLRLYDRWLMQFCADAPDQASREYLAEIMEILREEDHEKRNRQAGRRTGEKPVNEIVIKNSEKICIYLRNDILYFYIFYRRIVSKVYRQGKQDILDRM